MSDNDRFDTLVDGFVDKREAFAFITKISPDGTSVYFGDSIRMPPGTWHQRNRVKIGLAMCATAFAVASFGLSDAWAWAILLPVVVLGCVALGQNQSYRVALFAHGVQAPCAMVPDPDAAIPWDELEFLREGDEAWIGRRGKVAPLRQPIDLDQLEAAIAYLSGRTNELPFGVGA